MAGDVADGLIGHPMCSLRWVDEVVVPELREGLERSGAPATRHRLPADGLLRDRRRRGARDRRGAPDDRLLRDGAHLQAAVGDARLRRRRGGRRRRLPQGRPRRGPRGDPDEMVEAYTAAGPLDKVRARVEDVAERGDGLWLTPPTYFIPPEQIGEYQERIVEAFGPLGITRGGSRNRQREGSARARAAQWSQGVYAPRPRSRRPPAHLPPGAGRDPRSTGRPRISGPWPGG